jgi:ankyrin repeat protein
MYKGTHVSYKKHPRRVRIPVISNSNYLTGNGNNFSTTNRSTSPFVTTTSINNTTTLYPPPPPPNTTALNLNTNSSTRQTNSISPRIPQQQLTINNNNNQQQIPPNNYSRISSSNTDSQQQQINNNNQTLSPNTTTFLSSKAQKMLGMGTEQNDIMDLSFTTYVYKIHGMTPPPPPPQDSQYPPPTPSTTSSMSNTNKSTFLGLGEFANKIQSSVQNVQKNLAISTGQTAEQLKKTVETTIPMIQFEKLPIEQLLYKKRPEHVFDLAANNGVLLIYKEAIIVGTRQINMLTGACTGTIEIRSLVPLAGPGAEEKCFVFDVGGKDLLVEDVVITAELLEEKKDWIKAIAETCFASRGLPWHLVIRGTIWSAVALGDLEALSRFQGPEQTNATDHVGRCALHYAAETLSGGQAVALLLGMGADPNTLDDELASPLHLAARAGNALGIHALLRGGADPDSQDLLERTAFFRATEEAIQSSEPDAWLQVLEALSEGGADVEKRDVKDRTPLHLAAVLDDDNNDGTHFVAKDNNNQTLTTLLRPPIVADPNAGRGEFRRTPLHMLTLIHGDDALALTRASILLEHGARPNAVDSRGDSPLMLLLRGELSTGPVGSGFPITTKERISFAHLLIQYGARLDVPNFLNKTPLDVAKTQRLTFDESLSRWQQRKEPEVARILSQDPNTMWNLPRAAEEGTTTTTTTSSSSNNNNNNSFLDTSQTSIASTSSQLGLGAVRARIVQGMGIANVSMPWQVDTEVTHCVGCKRVFSTLQRKQHCKHCGLVFCTSCTTKTFVMSPPASFTGNPAPIRSKVCDGCFNSMSTLVERVADELHRLSVERTAASLRKIEKERSQQQAESERKQAEFDRRNELMGGYSASTTTSSNSNPDDPMNKTKQSSQSAHSAVARSRELLNDRGDAINRLAEQTDRMKEQAMQFDANATKLRQQAEKSWW